MSVAVLRRRRLLGLVLAVLVLGAVSFKLLCQYYQGQSSDEQPSDAPSFSAFLFPPQQCPPCPAHTPPASPSSPGPRRRQSKPARPPPAALLPEQQPAEDNVVCPSALPSPSALDDSEHDILLLRPDLHNRDLNRNVVFSVGIVTHTSHHHAESPGEDALPVVQLVQSLLDGSSAFEQEKLLFVVMIAESDHNAINRVFSTLYEQFKPAFESGLLHVIAPSKLAYPVPNTPFRKTYGETEAQVLERSKPNIDIALTMEYCTGRGRYHLQLMDDVVASSGYFAKMEAFVESKAGESNPPWSLLEFNKKGPDFGKLFRDSELLEIASMLRFFYFDHSYSTLVGYFICLKTQLTRFITDEPIFVRPPATYSLQTSLDSHLADIEVTDRSNWLPNIDAIVTSTMRPYGNYTAQAMYDNIRPFYAVNPRLGSSIHISFLNPAKIKLIVVRSGTSTHPTEIVESASIIVSFYDGEDAEVAAAGSHIITAHLTQKQSEARGVTIKLTKDHLHPVVIDQIILEPYF